MAFLFLRFFTYRLYELNMLVYKALVRTKKYLRKLFKNFE